jgi:hypothetical protein
LSWRKSLALLEFDIVCKSDGKTADFLFFGANGKRKMGLGSYWKMENKSFFHPTVNTFTVFLASIP